MKYIILGEFNIDILAYIQSKQAFGPIFLAPFIDGKFQKLTVIEDRSGLPMEFCLPFPIGNDFRMA